LRAGIHKANGQQFPLPKTAADVPGPVAGSIMTKEYVQSVGRTAYLFAWPLVNAVRRGGP
jgi:hypothetical protein